LDTKSAINYLDSARLGTDDYDYESVKLISTGGQAVVFEINQKLMRRFMQPKDSFHIKLGLSSIQLRINFHF
jgi:hypothetical protein